MSILPSFMTGTARKAAVQPTQTVDVPMEYEVDYGTGLLTGAKAEGKEAIKVWIWHCLQIERFRYPMYSWVYGTEFEQYIGQTVTDEYLQSDCRASVEEALTVNPYILGITDFEAEVEGDTLHISFTVKTSLGEVEIDV